MFPDLYLLTHTLAVSFVQVFIESCERLLAKEIDMVQIPLEGIIVMVVTIVVKLFVRSLSFDAVYLCWVLI